MTDYVQHPRIAVLIPAYNEEVVLKGTVDALVAAGANVQDIFVVDDRSTDLTVQVAHECGVNIFTVPVNGGKANAQKAALAEFKLLDLYEWIIFLDGDTKVEPDFIKVMREAAIKDPSVALYVGQVKSVKNNHVFSASRAVEYAYGQDLAKHAQSNFNVIFVSPGCSSMYRTDTLAKLHIDHLTLAEDMDLTVQLHRLRERAVYLPKAIVYTQDPSTLKDYNKQILRWYRGFWQVVLKHKVMHFTKKQPVDLYMLLLIVDATIFNRVIWLITLMCLFPQRAWQIMASDFLIMFGVSAYGAFRTRRWDAIWKYPACYLIGFLNIAAYARALVEIVMLRKELLAWNKVARYDFDSDKADTTSTKK